MKRTRSPVDTAGRSGRAGRPRSDAS